MDDVRHDAESYYLPVAVTNRGDRTAENVQVQAELDTGSGSPVTSEFTIAFLVGGEQVHGTFIFDDDPTKGELTVQATSYQEP